ncbi:MAG: hypothetical protein U0836_23565 [Pirellulales bacterium]
MKSLWTKFLTGIAVAGTLIGSTASAAGHKGFSFGGGGGGGNSMRSQSFSGNLGNALKINSNLNQNQFKARTLGNVSGSQFQSLSKGLKAGNQSFGQKFGSQIGTNQNQFKGLQRVGQLNGQNGKLLNQMFHGAQTFQGNKGLQKVNGLPGLVGGQFGKQQFNPAKFNGLTKQNNFFGSFGNHPNKSNKSFCFGNSGWCGWNNWYNPWCYRPYCYNYNSCYGYPYYCGYPVYNSYPVYNNTVTYVTPAQPVATEPAPQLPLADLLLTDLRLMDPGNGTDLGPRFLLTIANQGPSVSPPFQAGIAAAVSQEQLGSAVKAAAQVGPIQTGQTTTVEIRLPVQVLGLPSPNGPTLFGVLGVSLDELNQVDELDEQNNGALVSRDQIQPLQAAPAPQGPTANLAANGPSVPPMLSLPPQ